MTLESPKLTITIDKEYEKHKILAINAWNRIEEIKDEIATKYEEARRVAREIFDREINEMINILFENGTSDTINRACMIIANDPDIQTKCKNFPKSSRRLADHLDIENTKRILQKYRSTQNNDRRPHDVVDSSIPNGNTELSLVPSDIEILDENWISIMPYNVWHIQSRDKRFGLEYPGNQPADLIFNALYFYTEQGDLIIDPMAGGGVVGDVATVMRRQWRMYDINPIRPDIKTLDLTQGLPNECKNAELVFWDPPYFKKMDYGEKSISAFSRENRFLSVFEEAAKDFHSKRIKKIALLVSDYDDEYKGNSQDNVFIWHYVNAIERTGLWRVHRHIQCPLTTQQIHPAMFERYKAQKKLLGLSRMAHHIL